jgi:LysM repeat protein
MRKTLSLSLFLFLAGALILGVFPVKATPEQPQVFYYTPTADATGRIMYIVKAGESCTSISLLTGVPMDQLRLYNNLSEDCALYEGQELLLAIVEEPTGTPGPTPTPTSILPTPTPFEGYAEVCVFVYMDINGNAKAEEEELPLPGGAISISDTLGQYSQTAETIIAFDEDGYPLPTCFADVPQGEYNISVAIPDGFNATTKLDSTVNILAGSQVQLNFGAQAKSETVASEQQQESSEGKSFGVAIVGFILIGGGLLLGLYSWFLRRSSSTRGYL